jgi:hypothetical protein
MVVSQYTAVVSMALLDEDDRINDEKSLHNNFMDAHGVLFEMEDEVA